ncbi:DMT family transporter [Parathalassolituus penaei]|uniref:EamA family transporter n=1 Tax=Parathalassolituus penaei TaxID=2997323 RepID=A0A9X3EG92_9GAMM|nr:EamA family transporter [Parathalassolituus penaei]MCY0967053.1 EamA family transporter [Parathalassolituus penaei]
MSLQWPIALIAPLLWGTTYGVTQHWLADIDPLWVAALRSLLPGLMLLPLLRLTLWRQHGQRLVILSLFNLAIFTCLLFAAISRLPGGVAATLVSTVPLQVLVLMWFSGGKPSWMSVLAALTGVSGVALLVWQASEPLDWTGVVLALLAALSLAIGGLLTQKYGRDIPPLELAAAQFLVAGFLLTAVAWFSTGTTPTMTSSNWLAMIWIGPIGLGVGYWSWFRSLRFLTIDRLAFLGLLNPLVAVLLGLFMMNEQLSVLQQAGMMLVLGSVLVAQKGGRKPVVVRTLKTGIEPAS